MKKYFKKITVSVGIPAYNEEANIGYLLRDLLGQKRTDFWLEKIYIYSDGSSDRTESIVKGFQEDIIELVVGPGRKGQAFGQNHIFDLAKSDIVVLINADMQITDDFFLEKLIRPIVEKRADLTSSNLLPLPARNFFEQILVTGVLLKNSIFETYAAGNNYFTCHGAARAFSQGLYKKMLFPKSVGEDAYSFLFCLYNGCNYSYVKDAVVYYRLPDNFRDHAAQSTRFFGGRDQIFSTEFNSVFVKKHSRLPWTSCLTGLVRMLPFILKNFVYFFLYIIVLGITRTQTCFTRRVSDNWTIATSSKKVR